KYGLRTEKGQDKEDNFLYSLPSFIFFTKKNYPQKVNTDEAIRLMNKFRYICTIARIKEVN
ncbi:unnamed protein product, partial [marine sediment metagenome]